ncbi:hypothetical protein ABU162_16885 [Paenibacillus thiaminolyticus]|uniref:hypothetical protein n=1 Tax=Paenibacillus thiaminolyticus TaxID=49283 RepID=UPI0035A71EC3
MSIGDSRSRALSVYSHGPAFVLELRFGLNVVSVPFSGHPVLEQLFPHHGSEEIAERQG